jgi:hypothetical protein
MLLNVSVSALIYVTCVRPLNFLAAQIVVVTLNSCGSLLLALGSAISIVQLLYVAKFEITFSADPQGVGKKLFWSLAITVFLPNFIAGTYDTIHGIHVGEYVTLYTKQKFNGKKMQFLTVQAIFWMMLFFILNSLAFIFIPMFFRKRYANTISHIPMQTSKYIQRYLFGCLEFVLVLLCSVLFSNENDREQVSVSGCTFLFFCILLLAYHLRVCEDRKRFRKYMLSIFHVEEQDPSNGGQKVINKETIAVSTISHGSLASTATNFEQNSYTWAHHQMS